MSDALLRQRTGCLGQGFICRVSGCYKEGMQGIFFKLGFPEGRGMIFERNFLFRHGRKGGPSCSQSKRSIGDYPIYPFPPFPLISSRKGGWAACCLLLACHIQVNNCFDSKVHKGNIWRQTVFYQKCQRVNVIDSGILVANGIFMTQLIQFQAELDYFFTK